MANIIENSVARIWTNAQLRETKKQFKAAGFFTIDSDESFLKVTDNNTGKLVLQSMPYNRNMNMVRFDKTYFES